MAKKTPTTVVDVRVTQVESKTVYLLKIERTDGILATGQLSFNSEDHRVRELEDILHGALLKVGKYIKTKR